MPECPECHETLVSHAGRAWKYFHRHVIDGPYPNDDPHPCSLVNCAFQQDGAADRAALTLAKIASLNRIIAEDR